MLEPIDRDYVLKKLSDAIFIGLRGWFAANLGNYPDFLNNLPAMPEPENLAKAALNMALANGAAKYPGALVAILKGTGLDTDAKIVEIRKRVEALLNPVPMQAGANPFLSCALAHKLPFWNRTELRRRLNNLVAGRSVLIVNGSCGTGKTYTLQLLTHLKITRAAQFVLAPVLPPLDISSKSEVCPESLARSILDAMGLEPNETNFPDPQGKSLNQFLDKLVTWLLRHLKDDLSPYWIVLDGFGLEGVNPDCRAFIALLGTRISAGVYQGRIRLILINFPPDGLNPIADQVEEETTALPSPRDLMEAIESRLKEAGIPFEHGDVEQTLGKILALVQVPDTDPTYSRILNQKFRAVLYA